MAKSVAQSNATLEFWLRSGEVTTFYVALLDSSGAEFSGDGYARASIDGTGTGFTAAAGRKSHNAAVLTFPTPTASWGTPAKAKLYDASSGGDWYYEGSVRGATAVKNGKPPSYGIGALVIQET